MTIRDILNGKTEGVVTVPPDSPLDDAIATMVQHNVGCVVVVDGLHRPIGILSERDVLRLYNRYRTDAGKLRVDEVMTRDPTVGVPDSEEREVLSIMTSQRFRHLPIVHNGRLIGLVSLGDLVKARLAETEEEARSLKEYIYR